MKIKPSSIGSQWPRRLRRGNAAVLLLGMRVRIPPGTWRSFSFECCQVDDSVSGWSLLQRNPTECGVFECSHEASLKRRPWPTRGCRALERKWPFFCDLHIRVYRFL